MILYCIKCLIVTKNRSIKAKYEIDAEINFILGVLISVLKILKLLMRKN